MRRIHVQRTCSARTRLETIPFFPSPLPQDFIQHDACSDRHIKGTYIALKRQGQDVITMFADKPAHALVLAAQHQGYRPLKICIPEGHGSACFGSGYPDSAFLELFDGVHDVHDLDDGHVLERSCRSLRYRLGQTGCPPLGNDDAVNPGSLCCSQNTLPGSGGPRDRQG